LGSTTPLMTIGAGSTITGKAVLLDSTYGTSISPSSTVMADALTMSSGQISVVFDNATSNREGSLMTPHLTLAGVTLEKAQQAKSLTLKSYRSIDFYGSGSIGGSGLESISLSGSALRGYQQGAGQVNIHAADVYLQNSGGGVAPVTPGSRSGSLQIDSASIHLGANSIAVAGYQDLRLNASTQVRFEGSGSLETAGNLFASTPLITGAKASDYAMKAGGAISFSQGSSSVPSAAKARRNLSPTFASLILLDRQRNCSSSEMRRVFPSARSWRPMKPSGARRARPIILLIKCVTPCLPASSAGVGPGAFCVAG
jgi:hypothetical protein